jgi:hypothetical protein
MRRKRREGEVERSQGAEGIGSVFGTRWRRGTRPKLAVTGGHASYGHYYRALGPFCAFLRRDSYEVLQSPPEGTTGGMDSLPGFKISHSYFYRPW